ncbi:MAG: DEAD/DEAH box helicase, partial [Liquorilactobacillus satsumensis]
DLVDQFYVRARDFEKFDTMTRILDVQAPELTILFGRTKRRVDELSKGLEARGYNAKGIHGDLSQQRRMSILKQFKAGKLDILVATDVAARGLDISGVTHVYNYDIPQDPESYVHRIGRTGRAGHHGVSVTFVTPNEMDYLRVIERLTKKRMTPLKPPTEEEAFIGQISSAVEGIDDLVKKTNTAKFEKQVTQLLEKYDATDLIAALINEMAKDNASEVPVKITPERPLPNRRKKSGHYGHNNKRRSWHDRDNGKNSKGYKPRKDQNREKYSRDHKKKRKFTIRVKKD